MGTKLEELQQHVAQLHAQIGQQRSVLMNLGNQANKLEQQISAELTAERLAADSIHAINAQDIAEVGRQQRDQHRLQAADQAEGVALQHLEDRGMPELAAAVRDRNKPDANPNFQTYDQPPLIGAERRELPDTNNRDNWLRRWYGLTSLWYKYFDQAVLNGGKGRIHAHAKNTYDASLTNLSPQTLMRWYEGFYRNANSSALQFLLKTEKVIVVLDFGLMGSVDSESVKVVFADQGQTEYRAAATLTVEQLRVMAETVESHLVNHLSPR